MAIAEHMQEPKRVIIARTPFPRQAPVANETLVVGKVYDRPGQRCDVNTATLGGRRVWNRTAFLLQAGDWWEFYGRPALELRDKEGRVLDETGVIIDLTMAQRRGITNPNNLIVDQPGKVLGDLVVGRAFECAPNVGPITRIVAIEPEELRLASEEPGYPETLELSITDALLQDRGIEGGAWGLATRCLHALEQTLREA